MVWMSFDPWVLFTGICSKEIIVTASRELATRIFLAASLIIAKTERQKHQPKCPAIGN